MSDVRNDELVHVALHMYMLRIECKERDPERSALSEDDVDVLEGLSRIVFEKLLADEINRRGGAFKLVRERVKK